MGIGAIGVLFNRSFRISAGCRKIIRLQFLISLPVADDTAEFAAFE